MATLCRCFIQLSIFAIDSTFMLHKAFLLLATPPANHLLYSGEYGQHYVWLFTSSSLALRSASSSLYISLADSRHYYSQWLERKHGFDIIPIRFVSQEYYVVESLVCCCGTTIIVAKTTGPSWRRRRRSRGGSQRTMATASRSIEPQQNTKRAVKQHTECNSSLLVYISPPL